MRLLSQDRFRFCIKVKVELERRYCRVSHTLLLQFITLLLLRKKDPCEYDGLSHGLCLFSVAFPCLCLLLSQHTVLKLPPTIAMPRTYTVLKFPVVRLSVTCGSDPLGCSKYGLM